MRYNIKWGVLCFLVGLAHVGSAQTYQSKYGFQLPTSGTVKVLYIFAEAVGTCGVTYDGTPWTTAGTLPSDANAYIDHTVTPTATSKITDYFNKSTFNSLHVIGDYYNGVVSVPCSLVTGGDYGSTAVINALNTQWQPNASGQYLTANGQDLNSFDAYTAGSNYGQLKTAVSDGYIDAVVILWRNHPVLNTGSGLGVGNTMSATLKSKTVGLYGTWGYTDHTNDGFFIAEYFHSMMGSNNFHTGGGAGTSTFWTDPSSFSMSAQAWSSAQVVCGWDRYFLGIQGSRALPISAIDPSSGSLVTSDMSIVSHPNGATFILKDFVTVGDAVRIKLPHFNFSSDNIPNQYLWIENHQLVSSIDINHGAQQLAQLGCGNAWSKGLYAYLQVGKDVTSSNTSNSSMYFSAPSAYNNYLYPVSAEGQFDFYYDYANRNQSWANCQFAGNYSLPYGKYYPDGSIKPNPFTGFSDQYGWMPASNPSTYTTIVPGQTSSGQDYYWMKFQKYSGIPDGNAVRSQPYLGDQYDAFQNTGKILGLGTNPAPTPVYTQVKGNYSILSTENRAVWLNGISVTVLSKDYYGDGSGAYQIQVKWDDYAVDQNTRWCGYIRLANDATDPQARSSKVLVQSGKVLTLDRGLSPTQNFKATFPDGSFGYVEPTVLNIESGTVLTVNDNAQLNVVNGSSLVVKSGATLNVPGSASITVDATSKICVEPGAVLNITSNDLGGITTSNTSPVQVQKGDVSPVLVGGVPSNFLLETNVYGSITCNGPGLVNSSGTYSKAFVARNNIDLTAGFEVSAYNASSPTFTCSIQGGLQNCSSLFVPVYTSGGTLNVSTPQLRQEDNGSSHGISVDPNSAMASPLDATLSPNPSSGIFYLDLPDNKVAKLELLDALGKATSLPFDQMAGSGYRIDVSYLVNGAYTLRISTENDQVAVRRIVISK